MLEKIYEICKISNLYLKTWCDRFILCSVCNVFRKRIGWTVETKLCRISSDIVDISLIIALHRFDEDNFNKVGGVSSTWIVFSRYAYRIGNMWVLFIQSQMKIKELQPEIRLITISLVCRRKRPKGFCQRKWPKFGSYYLVAQNIHILPVSSYVEDDGDRTVGRFAGSNKKCCRRVYAL